MVRAVPIEDLQVEARYLKTDTVAERLHLWIGNLHAALGRVPSWLTNGARMSVKIPPFCNDKKVKVELELEVQGIKNSVPAGLAQEELTGCSPYYSSLLALPQSRRSSIPWSGPR